MVEQLTSLSDWLGQLGLAILIQDTLWVIPAIQSVHILAIGMVMASMAMLNLRLAGFIHKEQSIQAMTRRFYPWIWGGLVMLIITGMLMVLGEPYRELLSLLFWIKMGLIICAVAVTLPTRRMLENRPFANHAPAARARIRTLALISLLLWVLIVVCGRWIAYAGLEL